MALPLWAPLLMFGAGQYLQNDAQQDYYDQRRKKAREARSRQKSNRLKAREDTRKVIEKFDPTKRQERMEAESSDVLAKIEEVLEANAGPSPSNEGRISESVLNTQAELERDRADKASTTAAFLSKLQGFDDAGRGETDILSEHKATQRGHGGKSRRMMMADEQIQNTIQPDRLKQLLGGMASQAGLGLASANIMAGLAPGAAGGAATTTPNAAALSKIGYVPLEKFDSEWLANL